MIQTFTLIGEKLDEETHQGPHDGSQLRSLTLAFQIKSTVYIETNFPVAGEEDNFETCA